MGEGSTDNVIKTRIMDAGVKLFATRGFAATTTREIAEAAGVTKPMLYYYFESKEGLCRAALRAFIDEIKGMLDQAFASHSDVAELLAEVIWTFFEFSRDREDFARMAAGLMFGPEHEVKNLGLRDYRAEVDVYWERAGALACERGVARPGCQMLLAHALQGFTHLRVHVAYDANEALTRAQAAEFVERLLGGFGTVAACEAEPDTVWQAAG